MDSPSLPSSFTSSPMHISPTASTSTSSPPNVSAHPPPSTLHTGGRQPHEKRITDVCATCPIRCVLRLCCLLVWQLEWGGEFTELPPIKLYHTKEVS